ncbi:hypothetical protein ABT215_24450, partial [Streptomyces sp900105755]
APRRARCPRPGRSAPGCTGCTAVVLSTQPTMHTAHRLYERLGFVRTPDRDWNPLPEPADITLLTYELTL